MIRVNAVGSWSKSDRLCLPECGGMGTSVRRISISSEPGKIFFLRVKRGEDLGSGFSVVLCDGQSAWSGAVSEEEVSREAKEMEMKRENYVKDLSQALLTERSQEPVRYSFHVSRDGLETGALFLSYDKVQKEISFKLGSVELHAVAEPIEVIKELISHGLEHSTELQARNQHLQEENEKLRREWEYVTGELEKYVQAKETLEGDLYTRFALVLNEKKAKIRSLQQKLNHLQGDMESVNVPRRDTATVERKNPEEPDYEGTTDEENEENNACSQSSASARDKPGLSSLDVSLNDTIDVAPSRKRRQRHVRGQESDAKKGSKEGQEKGRVESAPKTSDVSNEAPQGSTNTASSAPEPEDLFDDI
ncbi:DNA repair protein XRCC4 isoform X2 [Lepisosteus oculatus]|uniref:DNA repair protein XRCC4 isoform X2 n=1 Tax=Lepisosteus oculatus TaxID=7918 RepID=UPI0037246971